MNEIQDAYAYDLPNMSFGVKELPLHQSNHITTITSGKVLDYSKEQVIQNPYYGIPEGSLRNEIINRISMNGYQ